MKRLLLLSLLVSASAFAATDTKHQIIFGNDFGTGWNISTSKGDIDSALGLDDYDISQGNLSLNYAFKVWDHLQVGLAVSSQNKTDTQKTVLGRELKTETNVGSLYLFATFNFSDDLEDSFYLTAATGRENYESTTKDDTSNTLQTAKTEYDVSGYVVQLGKRFNLKRFNIQNITYSPSLTFKYGTVSGDLGDKGVDALTTMQFDVIKFDLLF